MSRIGKTPIEIKSGIEISISESTVEVKGPKGSLTQEIPEGISLEKHDEVLIVSRSNDLRETKALHGLIRSLINNMVIGVTDGYQKELQLVGVGYRAQAKGKNALELQLGFSHPVNFSAPEGIEFNVPSQTEINISGIDKQVVGQVAADIRALKKPEPYKGKGIRYVGERIIRKAGKTAK
ncbi:MAG: 50S ribosomal protein L6 [Acidimicrobiaceae bacterium]|nr:MAG: 50S ribosomal protein L6 [marine actinobacterium MedAcidi-G2A]MBA4811028.1 50S ribosomal protein L6 [Acidimicrobiales bacterium]MBC84048.1 50S ribosomal protein L6 [Acidimicrobiaceae bacterium]MBU98416.1 50S ribosomal protein L6 [Acidimicrobiaceae bacterium]OUV01774.1 MAG: 50S ribosomal protein L6 [Acidimicrobiaceae bacterium TMED77]|tara:strand:+ start:4001 stop:4540 length:540 start_codon:yes stop_codon:yes gene_type:complete